MTRRGTARSAGEPKEDDDRDEAEGNAAGGRGSPRLSRSRRIGRSLPGRAVEARRRGSQAEAPASRESVRGPERAVQRGRLPTPAGAAAPGRHLGDEEGGGG